MMGFEAFQVSAWIDNGVTVPIAQRRDLASLPRRKTPWKTVVAVSFATSITVMLSPNTDASQATTAWRAPLAQRAAFVSHAQAALLSDAKLERLRLTERDRDQLLAALANPPAPADALRRAFAKYA